MLEPTAPPTHVGTNLWGLYTRRKGARGGYFELFTLLELPSSWLFLVSSKNIEERDDFLIDVYTYIL